MFLPAQYAWFEPVLIATIVVFIIDLVGNWIGFGNRFLGALMSAIVFALVFGTLVYFGYGSVQRRGRGPRGVATDAPREGGTRLAPRRPPRLGRIRYAPIATKFRSAARWRDVPLADSARQQLL
jgi:hypothetical protein